MANPIPNLFKIPELKEKILFTLMALLIYRFGAHITAPGIDVGALTAQFANLQGSLFGVYDMFVGGALRAPPSSRSASCRISPPASCSSCWPPLCRSIEKMQKEGEDGRKKLTQWTRYATVVLALAAGLRLRRLHAESFQGAVPHRRRLHVPPADRARPDDRRGLRDVAG